MPVKELREIAAAIGIDAASMKKGEVLEALLSAGTPDSGAAPEPEASSFAPAETVEKRKRGRPKGSVNKKKIAEPQEEEEQAEPENVQPKVRRGRRVAVNAGTVDAVEAPETPAAAPVTSPAAQSDSSDPFGGEPAKDPTRRAVIQTFRPFNRNQKYDVAYNRDYALVYGNKNGYGNQYGGQQQFGDKRPIIGQRPTVQRPYDQKVQIDRRFQTDKGFQPNQRVFTERLRPVVDQSVRREVNFPRTFQERTQDFFDDVFSRDIVREIPKTDAARAFERDEFPPETAETEGRETVKPETVKPEEEKEFDCYGILEINQNGYGFLRAETLYPGTRDIFVAPPLIRRHQLRTGDMITGKAKPQPKEFNAQYALTTVLEINGIIAENVSARPTFESLTPTYPDQQLVLETTRSEYATRIIDLFSPIGKGQRGLIVSPPKAGKTVLLKTIANSITRNYPDIHLIVLLIDERPEEVTDIKESVNAMVVASTFDEMTSRHVAVSEFCLEHAERLVEMGEDVVILMDSITRLARAYNQEVTPSGRSLSGGLDPAALYKPKKFFGAARNIKGGGSLTIIATALVDTGSRLDDVIYEEFKGTGNMELHLDRSLAERRIFPSIDITLSGTRKEELLLPRNTLDKIYALRRSFSNVNNAKDITEAVINNIAKTEDNKHFLNEIKITSYIS